jgi:hypothetical protein
VQGGARYVYICHDDEELALRTALATARAPGRGPRTTIARVERETRFNRALRAGRRGGHRPLDRVYGTIMTFPIIDRVCRPEVLHDDRVERLAQAIHRGYCRQRLAAGAQPGPNPALVAWENLPENLRAANRDQAGDIARKLEEIGCEFVPGAETGTPFAFGTLPDGTDEVELLSRQEHDRWSRDRWAHGWTYGPVRDDDARLHPMLVPWSQLPEPERDKDRQAVRLIPDLLAGAGFHIERTH